MKLSFEITRRRPRAGKMPAPQGEGAAVRDVPARVLGLALLTLLLVLAWQLSQLLPK